MVETNCYVSSICYTIKGGSFALLTCTAHLPSLAREATTEVILSLEWENGGLYLDPHEN